MNEKGVISKGKTVEEAIEKGLRLIGLTQEEVDIEILDEGKKGFLPFRSRLAIVKIQKLLRDNAHEKLKSESIQIDNKQKQLLICVKNNQLEFTNEESGSVHLELPEGIKFYKNGRLIEDSLVELTVEDNFEVIMDTEQKETEWSIEIENSNMEAILYVKPGYKKMTKLEEHPSSNKLKLKSKVEEKYNHILTIEDITAELKKKGIVYGIDINQLNQACLVEQDSKIIVAKSTNPKEGKNGWLEFKVEIKENRVLAETDKGTVDFRNSRTIPSVDEGTLIGVIHEPIEGIAGKLITGEEIPPKPVKPIHVRQGKGVKFSEDGMSIISTSWGRPSIEKRGNLLKVEVMPKLEHNGDVNIDSGNLTFVGDIEISGNIEDGMKVTATGEIEVKGTTSKAEIQAGQSAFLNGNIIGSNIYAGYNEKITIENAQILREIKEQIKSLLKAVAQLLQTQKVQKNKIQNDMFFPIVKNLIHNKFEDLIKNSKKFYNEVKEVKDELDEEWFRISKLLQDSFIQMNPNLLSEIEQIQDLYSDIDKLIKQAEAPLEEPAKVVFTSALNSEIYCSGDVTLINKGCYNSVIYAGGFLQVDGFVKSGRIFAAKGAELKEVGTRGGAPTLIIVPKDQKIMIKHAMADTTLQIGRLKIQLVKDENDVSAKVENGRIILR